jgi:hypothetical protein
MGSIEINAPSRIVFYKQLHCISFAVQLQKVWFIGNRRGEPLVLAAVLKDATRLDCRHPAHLPWVQVPGVQLLGKRSREFPESQNFIASILTRGRAFQRYAQPIPQQRLVIIRVYVRVLEMNFKPNNRPADKIKSLNPLRNNMRGGMEFTNERYESLRGLLWST